jgi:hypothetical protein
MAETKVLNMSSPISVSQSVQFLSLQSDMILWIHMQDVKPTSVDKMVDIIISR